MFHPWPILVLRAIAAFAVLAVASQASVAGEPAKKADKADASPRAVRAAFALTDAAGKEHSPSEWKGKKAVVLFFIATECPVSNFYSPDFARIARDYEEKGVVTYGVHCDDDLPRTAAAAHAKEYGLKFPVLLDPKQKLAAAVGAGRRPKHSSFRPMERCCIMEGSTTAIPRMASNATSRGSMSWKTRFAR